MEINCRRLSLRRIFLLAVCVLTLSLSTGAFAETPAEAEKTVYRFLTDQAGFSPAAACGVLGNMYCESRFYANVSGYNGFGLCQWAGNRRSNLFNYCAAHGLDRYSASAQVAFAYHELQTLFPGLLSYMRGVPNTAAGAYNAGYYWLVRFESPINPGSYANYRGSISRSMFWPQYGETELWLKAQNGKDGIKLTWTGKVSAKQVVLRSKSRTSGFEKVASVSKSTRAYTDKSVKRGRQYYYYVCSEADYKTFVKAKKTPDNRSNIVSVRSGRTLSDSDCSVKLKEKVFTYNGHAFKPGVRVVYKGTKLKNGKDYTVSYQNNLNAGKAIAVITGKGEYSGSVRRAFTIEKKQLKVTAKDLKVAYAGSKGKAVTPKLTAKGMSTLRFEPLETSDKHVIAIKKGKLIVTGKGRAEITLRVFGDKNHKRTKTEFVIRVK